MTPLNDKLIAKVQQQAAAVTAQALDADKVRLSMTCHAAGDNSRSLPLRMVIEYIANGKYRKQIEEVRATYQKTLSEHSGDNEAAKLAIKPLKRNLPAVQWSGTFKGRGDANLAIYSGLVCADLDSVDPSKLDALSAQLANDPHVVTVFVSPSGVGLKAVFRVCGDASEHGANCLAVQHHIRQVYGVDVDPSCKNLERLCFVSFDPKARLNAEAEPLTPQRGAQTNHSSASCILHPASLHSCIPASSISSASSTSQETILANLKAKKGVLSDLEKEHPGLAHIYETLIEPRFQARQGKRNQFVVEAVTFLFRAVSAAHVLKLVGCFYDRNRALFNDPREQHIKEAAAHLKAVSTTYMEQLSTIERQIYIELSPQQQDAFRICRDLSRIPEPKREPGTFFLAYGHLGDRIGVHPEQARRIMLQLQGDGLVKLLKNGTRRAAGVRGDACLWQWLLS